MTHNYCQRLQRVRARCIIASAYICERIDGTFCERRTNGDEYSTEALLAD